MADLTALIAPYAMTDLTALIARYAELRRRLAELDAAGEALSDEAEEIDAELVEIETQLPENYVFPGDDCRERRRKRGHQ